MTSDTLVPVIHFLLVRRTTFGVVTPGTLQWTAFQKDRHPYAWAIVDGIFVNVENHAEKALILKRGKRVVCFCRGYLSKGFVLSAFNYFLLQVLVHVIEIVAVACHPYQKIFVIFRSFLRCEQGSGVDNVELNMVSA